MAPTVSVLVATFNRAKVLPESLESILAQTVLPHQVIVINDGSTDETPEVVKAYSGRILYLEQKPNQGKATALNLGMGYVTGDYVWIMDDDDLALPDALELHLSVLEGRPEIGFTYSGCYDYDGRVFIPFDSSDPKFLIRVMRGQNLNPPGMLVRTSCYREIGPYDPELLRSQDYDMTVRLVQRFTCARIQAPTFILRLDFGPRGPSGDRFPFRKALLKAMEYDKKIFRKVRQGFPLHAYLPKRPGLCDDSSLTPIERRHALLQRASIMAYKGLHAEMAEDLNHASVTAAEEALSSAERTILWEFEWCHDEVSLRSEQKFDQKRISEVLRNAAAIARSKRLKQNTTGLSIKRECARGLYWRGIQAWRGRERFHAMVLFFSAGKVVGLMGVIRLEFQKLTKARKNEADAKSVEVPPALRKGSI